VPRRSPSSDRAVSAAPQGYRFCIPLRYAVSGLPSGYQIAYGNYKFYEDGSSSWRDMINTSEREELLDAVFDMITWLKENEKI
jgi:hypothetical protein